MVSTRARAAQPAVVTPEERPKKRAKVSTARRPARPEPTSSELESPVESSEDLKEAQPVVESISQDQIKQAEETHEAVEARRRNIGKHYSPGDGQLDYTLSEHPSSPSTGVELTSSPRDSRT